HMPRQHTEEVIPLDVKEIHDQHVMKWRKEDRKFIKSVASKNVEKQLRNNKCVLVVGRSGNGKSSIIRHLALSTQDEQGYQIIPTVKPPSDILAFHDQKRNHIFIIDDLLGKYRINAQAVDNWSAQIDEVLILLNAASQSQNKRKPFGDNKFLFATGINLYNDNIFQRLYPIRNYVSDISNWPINDQEKLAMLRKYIPPESQSKLTKKLNSDKAYFPLLCRIAEGRTADQIIRLFSNLNDFIKHDLLALKETNHLKFCIITLCAILKNNFKEDLITECYKLDTERKIFEKICMEFNLGSQQEPVKDDENTEKRYFDRLMIDLGQGISYSTFHNSQLQYKSYREKFISFFKSRKEKAIPLLKNLKGDTHNNSLDNNDYEDYIDCRRQHHFSSYKMRKPIIESAWEGYADIVQMLVDFDCDINKVDNYERTALFVACLLRKPEVVNVLLDHNADHSLCDKTKPSPLLVACRKGYNEIGDSPLIVASSNANLWVVQILSAQKPDVLTGNRLCQSPVYVASMKGHTDVLKYLLKNFNESFNTIDSEGRTPLFIACKHGHNAVVQILLDNQANILQCDWKNKSPIFIASAKGHSEIVKTLIQNDGDMNKGDDKVRTPLFIASDKGRTKTTEILVNNLTDYDLNTSDFEKRTPLDAASIQGFKDIVKLGSHFDIVKYLVENGSDVSDQESNGTTALLIAIEEGCTEIAKFLIDKGADINKWDNNKKTPLHRVVAGGHFEIVKVLVNKGALQTLTDNNNQTPFDLACKNANEHIKTLLRPEK
ncbi:Hypothetical predicted protein, partial [Mytilus galloprovincialis]